MLIRPDNYCEFIPQYKYSLVQNSCCFQIFCLSCYSNVYSFCASLCVYGHQNPLDASKEQQVYWSLQWGCYVGLMLLFCLLSRLSFAPTLQESSCLRFMVWTTYMNRVVLFPPLASPLAHSKSTSVHGLAVMNGSVLLCYPLQRHFGPAHPTVVPPKRGASSIVRNTVTDVLSAGGGTFVYIYLV